MESNIKTIVKSYGNHNFKVGDIVKFKNRKDLPYILYRIYQILPVYHSYEVNISDGRHWIGHDNHPYDNIRMQRITQLNEHDEKIYAKHVDISYSKIEKVRCKTNNINDWEVLFNEKHL